MQKNNLQDEQIHSAILPTTGESSTLSSGTKMLGSASLWAKI